MRSIRRCRHWSTMFGVLGRSRGRAAAAVGLMLAMAGCSGGSVDPGGTGGGSPGAGTGGATGSASGGASASGGGTATGSGGAATSTGGRAAGTGGAGTSTGGRSGTGGRGGTGGGATTTGGTMGGGGASAPTAGCNATTWPPSNDGSGSTPLTLDIGGTPREYYVSVPAAYDPSKPTRVVFAWHWMGGTARNVIGNTFGGGPYYGLKSRIPDAIYVAAQGLKDSGGTTGWPNTGGGDINFLKAMLTWLDTNYCVDKTRIFSTGFSYGGIMSDTIACQLGTTFRAIAPIAGSTFGGARCVNQPVAALMIHGTADTTLEISGGEAARDYAIKTNHCTTTTTPSDPSPCVTYSGCDAGYPVVWCRHTGGHTVPSFSPTAVAPFFLQF